MLRHLKGAMKAAKMQPLTWYQATRHTFASQWVMHERPIEKLAQTLGHGSTWVTERYAHLRDDYRPADYGAFDAAFGTADGEIGPIRVPDITKSDGKVAILTSS